MHDAMPDRLDLAHRVHCGLELRIVDLPAGGFEVLLDKDLVIRCDQAHLQRARTRVHDEDTHV